MNPRKMLDIFNLVWMVLSQDVMIDISMIDLDKQTLVLNMETLDGDYQGRKLPSGSWVLWRTRLLFRPFALHINFLFDQKMIFLKLRKSESTQQYLLNSHMFDKSQLIFLVLAEYNYPTRHLMGRKKFSVRTARAALTLTFSLESQTYAEAFLEVPWT